MALYTTDSKTPLGKGFSTGPKSLTNLEMQRALSGYKRTVASRYKALLREEIETWLSISEILVSPKIDGELWFLVMAEGEAFLANPRGRVVYGDVPFLVEAKEAAAKVKGLTIFAGEFFAARKEGRPRVGDLSAAMSGGKKAGADKLAFFAFDVLSAEVDGKEIGIGSPYTERLAVLKNVLAGGQRLKAIETEEVSGAKAVDAKYQEWVVDGKGEGVVARVPDGRVYKVKPSIALDCAVVAYSERKDPTGDKEQVRSILLALIREDGAFQLIGSCGNMPTEIRESLLPDLQAIHTEADYRHASSDGTLYRFVEPKLVVEIRVTDLQVESSSDEPIDRMALTYEGKWKAVRQLPGVSIIHPIFKRVRDDKSVEPNDVRMAQVFDRVSIPEVHQGAQAVDLPKSEVLLREAYTKTMKGELAVRKLLIWKTNKEEIDDRYPAFVVHFTDYSSGRKDPLKREVRLAPTEDLARGIADDMIKANIKSGWVKTEA